MRTSMRAKLVLIAIIAVVGSLASTEAWAHRGGGPNDPCERRLGASLVHLTLYQPNFDPDAEYCNEVPRQGKTVIIVDVEGDRLRQNPIALELIASDGSGLRKILSVPPRIYRRGVADAEVTLDSGSDYLARVVLLDTPGQTAIPLTFPIRVGAWYRPIILPALIIFAVLMLTAIPIVRHYMFLRGGEPDSDTDIAAA
jgi:hypothetical protein